LAFFVDFGLKMGYIVGTKKQNMGIATKNILVLGICALTGALMAQDGQRFGNATVVDRSGVTNLPNFIKLDPSQQMRQENFVDWAVYAFNIPTNSTFKPYKVETDELGYTHTRHQQYYNGYPVEASQVISHMRDGKITMVNGDYYENFSASTSASLSEDKALISALKKVKAIKYMWENPNMQAHERAVTNNPDFTYYPKGELVYVHKRGADYTANNMRLAYKFNIYAETPLYRANVFVDANTGEILDEQNLICTADVVGSANTKYSGTVTMTSDNNGGTYRLRETGRGNGIQTYDLNNGTSTGSAVDFTNATSTWNLSGVDQAATDAHWGAEMTYDYFMQVHNRNSIDGSGYLLRSYVHYSTNYVNAFWNGSYMTYGDGDVSQGYDIMTALDVCGHEITHGLVSNTAGLGGGEAGALNEAFADIFGTNMEVFARPSQNDWRMGADLTTNGQGLRNMANPNQLQQPDTYNGTYWDGGGEVHINDGPCIYWYYLLCQGGSGTNDNSDPYNVSGITMNVARHIAFRGLTVYFTSNTNYANARTHTIQAALDLHGNCSQEVASTTNAWYAVGVGAAYNGGVPTAGFAAANTSSCTAPLTVNFTNTSNGAVSYNWDFGDGGTSTTASPAHTYTAAGVYNVQMIATGTCSPNSKDTVLLNNLVVVNGAPNAANPPFVNCGPQSYTLNGTGVGNLTWYDASGQVGTGPNYTTPTLTATTTYSVTSSVMVAGTNTLAGAPAANTTLGGGGYLNYAHYLTFDAFAGFTLKTVDVYAQSSSSSQPTFELQDNNGATIYSLSPSLTSAGLNVVTLNWHIPPGTGYILAASGANLNLYRNNTGASYPIAVGSVASITGNDVMGTAPNYYYWFYNWKYAQDVPCPSNPTVVTATIQNCTGIASQGSSTIEVHPNPAHNNLFINAPHNISSVTVVDMIGKTIMTHTPQNETSVSLDVSALPAGVYFVKVVSGDSNKLIKVVKQ